MRGINGFYQYRIIFQVRDFHMKLNARWVDQYIPWPDVLRGSVYGVFDYFGYFDGFNLIGFIRWKWEVAASGEPVAMFSRFNRANDVEKTLRIIG